MYGVIFVVPPFKQLISEPGTIIVFDEWVYNHSKYYDDHEAKAFFEWVAEKNRTYEFFHCI